MPDADPRIDWLLRLGDNCLILSHRLCQWCGHGPALEEDLALSNVALDLLGQARLWLAYAGELENAGRDEDQLVYLRDSSGYRNLLLVEQPNGDFAQTMARQLFFDLWQFHLLQALTGSADARVADIAAKSHKEVTYHLARSSDWVIALGDGTAASRTRMQTGFDLIWPYTGEMFEMDALDHALLAAGIGVDLDALRAPWQARIESVCEGATLARPSAGEWMQSGGKHGVHSEELGFLLAEMQFLQRAYPGADW